MESYSDILSFIRKEAKKVGLTFKRSNVTLNGKPLYMLVTRKTGIVVLDNYQFITAFNDACAGYIANWDGDKFGI